MRLDQLLNCIEVADCGSISQAAKTLYITQPTLSTGIQNLEKELNFPIFARSGQGMVLTEKGAQVIERARVIAQNMQDILLLSTHDELVNRNVTIASVPALGSAIVTELLTLMKQQNCRLNLSIIEVGPDKALTALQQNQADIVVGSYIGGKEALLAGEAAKYNLVVEPLYTDQLVVYLSRKHPLAKQTSVTVADLQGETLVYLHVEDRTLVDGEGDVWQEQVGESSHVFTDQGSIKKLVAEGVAVTILPLTMAYDDIYVDAGQIVTRPFSSTEIPRPLYLYVAYRGGKILEEEDQQLVEMIKQVYQQVADKMQKQRG